MRGAVGREWPGGASIGLQRAQKKSATFLLVKVN